LVTTYEVRNVLRIYGNHLKRRGVRAVNSEKSPYTPQPDLVDISIEARRRQTLSQMSSQLISRIVPPGQEKTPGGGEQGTDSMPGLVAGAQTTI
jgi:hypothetical protein